MDPGYLRLKHAFKTILAILISLSLTKNQSMHMMLIAGIGSGIAMQGIVAKSLPTRLLQILLLYVSYLSAFSLGLYVKDSTFLTTLALMSLGFLVNYIRRFNLESSIAPTMIWLLCFLATILPLNSSDPLSNTLEALLIGMGVSGLVFLIIFPENYNQLFILNANHLFEELGVGLSDLRRRLGNKDKTINFEDSIAFQQIERLEHLLDSSQNLSDNLMFLHKKSSILNALLHQYALTNAYKIIVESYQRIQCEQIKIPRHIHYALTLLNRDFSKLFFSVSMQKDYSIHMTRSMVSLKNWTDKLNEKPPKDPELIMLLLNLKLGFHLFNKNLTKLLWPPHET